MQTMQVMLPSIEVIQQFIKVVNTVDVDMDLGAGATVIDAKSLLGVIALAKSKRDSIKLTVYSEDEKVLQPLQPFLAC